MNFGEHHALVRLLSTGKLKGGINRGVPEILKMLYLGAEMESEMVSQLWVYQELYFQSFGEVSRTVKCFLNKLS